MESITEPKKKRGRKPKNKNLPHIRPLEATEEINALDP